MAKKKRKATGLSFTASRIARDKRRMSDLIGQLALSRHVCAALVRMLGGTVTIDSAAMAAMDNSNVSLAISKQGDVRLELDESHQPSRILQPFGG